MMTSAVFYLALMFSLGTCAVVNIVPEISEGKIDEVINGLEDVVEELKVDEEPTQNPNVNFALENPNPNSFFLPIMRCAWHNRVGACCFAFHFTSTRVCMVMIAAYPHLHYMIKAGTKHITRGFLNNHNNEREVDIQLSYVKVEFTVKIHHYTSSILLMCFKADYHTHLYKFDGTIGCMRKSFYDDRYDEAPSMSIM
ncbi:Hypothetical predicted protein [Octopus vulgaris]|uniref:Uncharacterized protein n=1 Tax=Octopus vulgaris TaxID=6645 RepID=A0AA36FC25_OCTVU|nr:Hypothetical predicted protein [Octopus vulgaris]